MTPTCRYIPGLGRPSRRPAGRLRSAGGACHAAAARRNWRVATHRLDSPPAAAPIPQGSRAPVRDRSAERWLVLAVGLAAALPVIASTIRALSLGWVPLSDQAVAATRAYDVFTSWTPLVGPWSSTSNTLAEPTYHAGPMLYWLLALPARLPGSAAFPVAMGVVNTAAVVGAVALARRRGGRPLMFATAGTIALMCAALETQVPSDIWNPSAPLLPFTLLIFLCWSLACGEHRVLPVTVLVASFAVQCHLILLVPVLGLLGVGLAGLVVSRVRGSSSGSPPLRRWVVAALLVGLVCWSAPIVDQTLAWAGSDRGRGNIARLVEAAGERESPVGVTGGARAVAQAVGIPPSWLQAPQPPEKRTFAIFAPVGATRLVSTLVVLGGLLAVVALGVARRRTELVAAAALALVLCAALVADTASFPNTPRTIFSYGYASWWAIPAGMWVWLVLGWSAVGLVTGRVAARGAPAVAYSPYATGAALGAVVVVAAVVVAGQEDDRMRPLYGPTRTVVERLDTALPDPGTVRVDAPTFVFTTAVIHSLRRNGATIVTRDTDEFGPEYMRTDRRVDQVVDIRPGGAPAPGARTVARVRVPPRGGLFTVSLRSVR